MGRTTTKNRNETETEKTPTRRGFPIYDENPSIRGRFTVSMKANLKGQGKATMICPDTGEILEQGTFGFVTEEEVDNEKFIKFYKEGVHTHGQLTKAGRLFFDFVFDEITGLKGKDKDTIMLNHYIAQKWKADISRSTYYRGMNELLEKGFLFRSPAADVYFINVRFMFNGDRLTVIKSYRRKGSGQSELPLNAPPLLIAKSE